MTTNRPRGSFASMYEASRQVNPEAGPRPVRLDALEPNAEQPRQRFHQETIEELAASIRVHGLLQPIMVRPAPSGAPGRYQIVAGERRYHACKLVGLEAVPVVIKALDDHAAREVALIENLQRENITPLEEAQVLRQILEETRLTHQELGERIGKTKAYVEQRVRLLRYPPEVQAGLMRGMSPGHAKAVVQLESQEAREALIALVEGGGMSVREAERRVHQLQRLCELPEEQQSRHARAILSPAGVPDADLERRLSATPPPKKSLKASVDLRETQVAAFVLEAAGTGKWEVDGKELLRRLRADMAALRLVEEAP